MDLFITVTLPDGSVLSLQPGVTLVAGAVPIVTGFVPIPFAVTLLSVPMPAAPPGGYEWTSTLLASGSTINVNPQDKYPFKLTP